MNPERTTHTLPGWVAAIAAVLITLALAFVTGVLIRYEHGP